MRNHNKPSLVDGSIVMSASVQNAAVIPGSTFGVTDRCALRVSYGPVSAATAAEGAERLVRGLRAILKR